MEGRAWVRQVLVVALGGCLAVLVCVIVYKIRSAFVPFAAGLAVAYVLDPLLDRLEARGWSRSRAVWTVMACLIGVLVLTIRGLDLVGITGAALALLVGQVVANALLVRTVRGAVHRNPRSRWFRETSHEAE